MKTKSTLIFLSIVIGLTTIGATSFAVWKHFQNSLPVMGSDSDGHGKTFTHVVPDFDLINQDSLPFTYYDLKNKVTAVNFFFTTCSNSCPKVSGNLYKVQKAFAGDNRVAISFNQRKP